MGHDQNGKQVLVNHGEKKSNLEEHKDVIISNKRRTMMIQQQQSQQKRNNNQDACMHVVDYKILCGVLRWFDVHSIVFFFSSSSTRLNLPL